MGALHDIPDALSGETADSDDTIATLLDKPEPQGRWDVLSQFGAGIGSPFELGAATPEGDPKDRPPTAHELTEAAADYVTLVEQSAPRPAFELRKRVGSVGLHPGAVEALVAAAGGEQAAATRGRVLVVDGDPVARHLLALRLGNEGYDVETVADGRAALEAVRAKPPSAVLSETVLAGLDGYGLLDAMKREGHGGIPFVFVSSRADPLSTNKGLLLGAADFLAKPINTEVLLTKLQKLMGEALRRADVSARITLSDVEGASVESYPTMSYDELVPGVSVMARFRLLADLGEGGMGKVFKAHDERLEEDVVIKVMKDSLTGDPKVLEHFKREIRLARKISHPAVVRIYDFWEAGPLNFVTMEFLEGVDLRHEVKRRGALPMAVAIRLATELFEGLAAAHDIGVVHRDIKPHNVLLLAGGHVKILDFGIAQGLDPTSPDAKTLTTTPVGTPEYMSPEQLLGEKLTAKTDLYSGGVVFFELLTGRLPFVGEDRMQTAMLRLQADAPPPSSVNPGLAPAVDRVVLRLLARDRSQRPASAEAALVELRQLRGLA